MVVVGEEDFSRDVEFRCFGLAKSEAGSRQSWRCRVMWVYLTGSNGQNLDVGKCKCD